MKRRKKAYKLSLKTREFEHPTVYWNTQRLQKPPWQNAGMVALFVKLDGHKRRSSPSDEQKRGAALARISGERNGGK